MNDKRIIDDTSIDSKELFFLSRDSVLDKSVSPEILLVDDLPNIEASFSIILFMSELNLIKSESYIVNKLFAASMSSLFR